MADKFTKKELLVLCTAYELTVSKQKKIDYISNQLQIKILQCDNINVNLESNLQPRDSGMSDLNLPGPSGMSDDLNLHGPSCSAIEASGGHLMTSPEEQPTLNLEQVYSSEISETVQKKTKTVTKGKGNNRKCSRKSKGKVKGKSKKSKVVCDTGDTCEVCGKREEDGEEWISCDFCLSWYHRACAGLEDDNAWNKYATEDG